MANRKVLPPAAGIGRKKGIPNKATTNAREAIAALVEGNVGRLEGWLDQIAEKDPMQAYRCFMDVIEYHIPKLARTEHTGADGGPVRRALEVTFITPKPDGG